MQVKKAEFILSAANSSQWPNSNLPEVLFCGRSNVGKSSLINLLTNRKNMAFTSSTPGMTRMLNFYNINDSILFVDAPGYGYQKKNQDDYIVFDQLMSEYFAKRRNLKLCILVLDARREPNEDDLDMLEYLQSQHKNCLVFLSKCDKLSGNEMTKQKRLISSSLGIPESELYPFSALKKTGMDNLWARMERALHLK